MGITINILRDANLGGCDCTNGGVTSKAKRLTIVNVEGPDNPSENAPAALLEENTRGTVRIVPVEHPIGCTGPMFGGNYATVTDSRFVQAVEAITGAAFYGAIAVHDRFETWDEHERFSR